MADVMKLNMLGDVVKILNLSPAMGRTLMLQGKLVPAAKTPGGVALFTDEEIERVRLEREARRSR